eukprot:gnl/TRDRNA2_/TRDRNA2_139320_c3_seq1.p2 gnl/TRDRNA2_/TRDRNA2_139320_c3~~gnl/TRDRNA2_/TRDRNA2_139320_c3_seq1.p2  ORF type:complete len:189 (-),score=32.12 gnl/TRDRNA2_/TRDRNA2_139320_c3_seq1:21-587(-)
MAQEGVESRMAKLRQELLNAPLQAALPGTVADAQTPRSPTPASRASGVPVVLGRRVEWSLSASMIDTARKRGGPLVTGELEVASTPVRLKFFPDGSPSRSEMGFCSLYLLALEPVAIRFVLFAGPITSALLECTYERKRDQGRHDLCRLEDALDPAGGVVVGAEVMEVRQLPRPDGTVDDGSLTNRKT